jgi:hypothetical protein
LPSHPALVKNRLESHLKPVLVCGGGLVVVVVVVIKDVNEIIKLKLPQLEMRPET